MTIPLLPSLQSELLDTREFSKNVLLREDLSIYPTVTATTAVSEKNNPPPLPVCLGELGGERASPCHLLRDQLSGSCCSPRGFGSARTLSSFVMNPILFSRKCRMPQPWMLEALPEARAISLCEGGRVSWQDKTLHLLPHRPELEDQLCRAAAVWPRGSPDHSEAPLLHLITGSPHLPRQLCRSHQR